MDYVTTATAAPAYANRTDTVRQHVALSFGYASKNINQTWIRTRRVPSVIRCHHISATTALPYRIVRRRTLIPYSSAFSSLGRWVSWIFLHTISQKWYFIHTMAINVVHIWVVVVTKSLKQVRVYRRIVKNLFHLTQHNISSISFVNVLPVHQSSPL